MTNTKSAVYEYKDFNWPIIYIYIVRHTNLYTFILKCDKCYNVYCTYKLYVGLNSDNTPAMYAQVY